VAHNPIRFGEELRRKRLAAGLTLTDLAQLVHYSKGQLSKVERGIKRPSRELARLCDAALDAKGTLATLVPESTSSTDVTTSALENGEVWLMQLFTGGQGSFQPVSRRQAVAIGTAAIPGICIGWSRDSINVDDLPLLGVFRSFFDQYRQLGQVIDPGLLLPALIAQTHTLQELSTRTGSRTRQDLLRLASRYAEYVGWLVQETGNEQGAL